MAEADVSGGIGTRHALVVGGTGMLREVSLTLAQRGHVVSVVARSRRRLRSLAAVAAHGPVDPAVVWIHGDAPDAPMCVARETGDGPRRYFHVLGSAAADPSAPAADRRERFEVLAGLAYHEVILGFVVQSGGSRWLTDSEIAAGVLGAVASGATRSVAGVVEPWSARP